MFAGYADLAATAAATTGEVRLAEGDPSAAARIDLTDFVFWDDFMGKEIGLSETGSEGRWDDVIVSTQGTVGIKADINAGAATISVGASDEAQDAVLYMADQLNFDIDSLTTLQFRAKVITPGVGTVVVMGMAGDHNLDKDTIAQHAWFRLDASLALKVESDDGTNDEDDVAAGTIVTDTWYVFRIDFSEVADVKFYLDGAQVGSATTFDMSNYTGNLQPYFSIDKASGVGTAEIVLDYTQIKGAR